MLTSRAPFPVLNNAFRRANKRLSVFDSISVETALLKPSMNATFKADLHINITEHTTGHGVPKSPYSVYLDGTKLTSGRCDSGGQAVEPLVLPAHKNEIDTYHGRRRFIAASSHHTVLWDNFNDNSLDKSIWETFAGTPAFYEGKAEIREEGEEVKFVCTNTGYLAGIYTKSPVDVSNSRLKVKLFSGGWVVCFLSILPSNTPFYGANYNQGYDIGIWQNGMDKFIIYSGKDTVYSKGTLRGNPETIEIIIENNTIRFLEEGNEVYKETYKSASKLCNIYLWGQSWYHFKGGTSWSDDFQFTGE